MNAHTIRERFSAARSAGKRAKDAAESIGISEGAAVAAHCGPHDYPPKALPLRGPWVELLQALEPCGPLMALTRNESVVHEKTGIYTKVSSNGHVGLALGEDIDLRLFFQQWHAGFAVTELAANPGNRASTSLQFFDRHGKAVHKIFSREATDQAVWAAVAQRFSDAALAYEFLGAPAKPEVRADAELDATPLLEDWSAMQDTHEFFGLLKKHGLERQQSFRLAEGRYTWRLASSTVREMLLEAAFEGTPIMCFVSSGGCIQIHTGPVIRVEPMQIRGKEPGAPGTAWLNVLDPSFNLHLREDHIANVWLVEKPTADGVVTSLEAFDAQGELITMFFGARKPGKPELQDWRDIAHKLTRLAPQAEAAAV